MSKWVGESTELSAPKGNIFCGPSRTGKGTVSRRPSWPLALSTDTARQPFYESRALPSVLAKMSFSFQWPRFSDQFHADAIEMLNAALNKGPKPPVIADKIEVVELEMGTQVRPSVPESQSSAPHADLPHTVVCQPPELEIRDIGDLTTEQFRGIFRLTYSGDAYIVLRTKVQVRVVRCFMLAVNPPLPPHAQLIPAHTHLWDEDSLGGRTPLAYIY